MSLTNRVSEEEVHNIFSRVAPKYDVMNNIISLGIQKKWRRLFLDTLNPENQNNFLDLCCGTGDSTIDLLKKGDRVVGLDFNEPMLKIAKRKSKEKKLDESIDWVKGNAMDLPFRDDSFDLVTICFGLRNVPDARQVTSEVYRVLKPGGCFAVLEMSQPTNPVIKLGWNLYFKLFPYFAKLTRNKVADYRYLSKTSKNFFSAVQLKELMEEKGFKDVSVTKLTWGVGAIHIGQKK
ncbi:bifunctional demethylmenaquinone methyltransferase/2-methoxy-6-polyprenyl-1,4-benzoquinol methylase UbiE [Lactobacillus kalixensis]|uniref:Demethylmenaquinone methyltransferase n=1 Tax=Lactobacillus kalixensis DSM 16043 TaxID=1423763 RepID=A0A0R1UMT6_9LACO|nr:bifunctional demethylmenaquinone methyltransferase/2-methoxy-6-polyprenyl-1,4-benzoquinol methylase UbiE [Lactobacillus kalixensis]KRL90923.1 ubiquinone menaquinone biosynthesis methyltransferase ubie [Lactobacillus kalixensis DSM 16043]